jgi:hypothetical protein
MSISQVFLKGKSEYHLHDNVVVYVLVIISCSMHLLLIVFLLVANLTKKDNVCLYVLEDLNCWYEQQRSNANPHSVISSRIIPL